MSILTILEAIKKTPDCRVFSPKGLPKPRETHHLPLDVQNFYKSCGGAILYESSGYSTLIVPPNRIIPANPVIVGGEHEDDITFSWYIICADDNGNYLTIDLGRKYLGRCYDSFSDRHGVRGSCPVIARSFSELINRLLANNGQHWYWLQDNFESLGDAYD